MLGMDIPILSTDPRPHSRRFSLGNSAGSPESGSTPSPGALRSDTDSGFSARFKAEPRSWRDFTVVEARCLTLMKGL